MLAREIRSLVVGALVLLTGCNDTRDLAPSSPSAPWQSGADANGQTGSKDYGVTADHRAVSPSARAVHGYGVPFEPDLPWPEHDVAIDPVHAYSLAELIDLAERNNKETRIAWEQARQAATEVGIARAALLPQLTVDALAGYTHSALPFPSTLDPRGYITSNGEGFFPELVFRYLLFDFGATHAAVRVAREASFASNVAFNGAHQRLISAVAKAYYLVGGADAELTAARASVDSAGILRRAAESRYAHGEGTVLDVALARRATAQAELGLVEAAAARREAMLGLVSVLGYAPATPLHVADAADRPLPRGTADTVSDLMRNALRTRPDVLADLARLRAAEAGVALARDSFYPKVSISAHVNGNIGSISVNNGPTDGIAQPEGGVFLRLDWPIYDGGLRRNELRRAESKRSEAEDVLQEGEEKALRDVASAFDRLEEGLAEYHATVAVVAASETAFMRAKDAYAHGLGSVTDAASAATALAQARADNARAHMQAMANAAALALSTGSLTSVEALP